MQIGVLVVERLTDSRDIVGSASPVSIPLSSGSRPFAALIQFFGKTRETFELPESLVYRQFEIFAKQRSVHILLIYLDNRVNEVRWCQIIVSLVCSAHSQIVTGRSVQVEPRFSRFGQRL